MVNNLAYYVTISTYMYFLHPRGSVKMTFMNQENVLLKRDLWRLIKFFHLIFKVFFGGFGEE